MLKRYLGLLLLLVLVGCQTNPPDVEIVLPTLADPQSVATDDAATRVAIASPTRQPLPPTFTPSPTITPIPIDPASLPTATPIGFRATGTLFYLFNGDAIIELAGDGSFEDLLPIPHIGQGLSGLALAPTDDRLAYVAPGSGSAREVYVVNRDGSNARQVSQLGFAEVQTPVWRPDGGAVAFIAAQSELAPMGIYVVDVNTGDQRRVLELPTRELRDLAWDRAGDRLFFSNQTLFVVDAKTGAASESLTAFTGFGPDFSPVHSPTDSELYYLKMMSNLDTGQRGGVLSFLTTDFLTVPMLEREGADLYVNRLEYSRDGAYLLVSSDDGIWIQDQEVQTASSVIQELSVPPRPALRPDAEQVAFVGLDERFVEQIFVMDRRGGPATQITFHQEGTISDLEWAAG